MRSPEDATPWYSHLSSILFYNKQGLLEQLWEVCARRLKSREMVVYWFRGTNPSHRVSMMKCISCGECAQIMYAPSQKKERLDEQLVEFVRFCKLTDIGDADSS